MKISKIKMLTMMGVLFALLCFAVPVYAEISLGPDFQGTLVVTSASGEVNLINAGESIPPIAPNSVIEVLNGSFTVATGKGESIRLSCHGQTVTAAGGASVTLTSNNESGLLKVIKGPVTITDEAGKELILEDDGAQYPFGPAKKKAAPAAAGEPTGGAPAGGDLAQNTPVDSRSLESSPSQ